MALTTMLYAADVEMPMSLLTLIVLSDAGTPLRAVAQACCPADSSCDSLKYAYVGCRLCR